MISPLNHHLNLHETTEILPTNPACFIPGSDRMLRILRRWTHSSYGHHHRFVAAKAIGQHTRQEALPVGGLT